MIHAYSVVIVSLDVVTPSRIIPGTGYYYQTTLSVKIVRLETALDIF